MVIAMVKASNVLAKYDLSTVSNITIGAAPLTEETADKLRELQPNWKIIQGYGNAQSLSRSTFLNTPTAQISRLRNCSHVAHC